MTLNSANNSHEAYLILGATGDIGSALCRLLSAKGAKVMAAGKDQEKLEELSSETGCSHFQLDASNFDEVDKCFEKTLQEFGRLDGAANCVGSLLLKPAHLTSYAEFSNVIAANLNSAFACVRSSGKVMRKEGGSVVLVSSAAASIGLANHEAISAAKAGIEGLMLAAAASYSRQKIRVNCIAPGLVQTKLTKSVTSNENSRQASLSMHPLGRLGEAADIAQAIAWLLSKESSWITGQVLAVDGGLSKVKIAQMQLQAAR